MTKFKDYMVEKTTKKEFEEVLENPNILAGCEFEFYFDDASNGSDVNEIDDLIYKAEGEVRDAMYNIEAYREAVKSKNDDINEEINAITKKVDELDYKKSRVIGIIDELKKYVSIISTKGEDEKEDTISRFEKEVEDISNEINKLEDEMDKLNEYYDDANGWLREEYNPIPNIYTLPSYYELMGMLYNNGNIDTYGMDNERTFDETCIEWFENNEIPYPGEYLGVDILGSLGNGEIDSEAIEASGFPIDLRSKGVGGTRWEVKEDGSLGDKGIEIVTPIITIKDLIDTIEKVFRWIDNSGYTDESCGFHVHMSIKTDNQIDALKLILFAEEELIYKYFDDRKNNSYAQGIKDGHINPLKTVSIEDMISITKSEKLAKKFNTEKYTGIHLIELEKNHVEFRYMGGNNYHNKFKEVRELIVNYGHWLSIACDPEYKRKEYIQKINRLVNTFNRIYIGMIVVKLRFYLELIEMAKDTNPDPNKMSAKKRVIMAIKQKLKPYEQKFNSIPVIKSYDINGVDIKRKAESDIDEFLEPLLYNEIGIHVKSQIHRPIPKS